MRTKAGEKQKLRATILDKTLVYLKQNGRVGAGTQAMMEQLGLTRGALYSHFKSKDDLFVQAVCADLEQLEASLENRFREQGVRALRSIIEDHLSERSLNDVGASCVFTSLSSDMQRCKAAHRKLFETHVERIFGLFAHALQVHFPRATSAELDARARNLYAGLVGTLTMARTVKDSDRARRILMDGRAHLIECFAPKAS